MALAQPTPDSGDEFGSPAAVKGVFGIVLPVVAWLGFIAGGEVRMPCFGARVKHTALALAALPVAFETAEAGEQESAQTAAGGVGRPKGVIAQHFLEKTVQEILGVLMAEPADAQVAVERVTVRAVNLPQGFGGLGGILTFEFGDDGPTSGGKAAVTLWQVHAAVGQVVSGGEKCTGIFPCGAGINRAMPSGPDSPRADDPRALAGLLHIGLEETVRLEQESLADDEPAVNAPGEWVGGCELLELLGEGGFGQVWRARQAEPLVREVALKVIKPGMDSREIIARFRAEQQALALMDHPNIAAVLDAGRARDGRPWFAMELVAGQPITDYCDRHRLPLRDRLELFVPVCLAVQHAHQKGVLHRDLKPSNILVAEVDGRPVPKVIDFGIAKALQSGDDSAPGLSLLRTTGLSLLGTPLYMSPEQAGLGGQDVDSRSDIYSLGAVLYELIVGVTPMDARALRGSAVDEMLRLIREHEPPGLERRLRTCDQPSQAVAEKRRTEIKKLAAQMRGELEWIVLKALEKDRERRHATAAALAEDIERHLRDEPVSAGPPSTLYRWRKLARRHQGKLAGAALLLLSLLAGFGFSVWQAVRATRAEHMAEARLAQVEEARAAAEGLINEGIHGLRDRLMALGRLDVMEDMAKAAEDYFRRLPPELNQNDETLRHLASLALNRGMIAEAAGDDEEHQRQTLECLRLTEELLARHPEDERLVREACAALLDLCSHSFNIKDRAMHLRLAERITSLCDTWLESQPRSEWALYTKALALNGAPNFRDTADIFSETVARLEALQGDSADVNHLKSLHHYMQARIAEATSRSDLRPAREQFELSAAHARKAMESGRPAPALREGYYDALHHAGSHLRREGRKAGDLQVMKRGEAMIREAMAGRRQLLELEPGRVEWWRDVGHSHNLLSDIANDAGSVEQEHAEHVEELRCRQEVLERAPNRPLHQEEMAISLQRLADAKLRLGHSADEIASLCLRGLEHARRAIEMAGMNVVYHTSTTRQGALVLSEVALANPHEGVAWLEQAVELLQPLAGKVPRSDMDATTERLGRMLASVREKLAPGTEPESASEPGAATPHEAGRELPFINTLGMRFLPVPVAADAPLLLFSVWETRVRDYEPWIRETRRAWPPAPFPQSSTHPVINVTWEDARAYCEWLTTREQRAGRLPAQARYRLPTDHEWSCAAGIGNLEDVNAPPREKSRLLPSHYPWGSQWPPPVDCGNIAGKEWLPTGRERVQAGMLEQHQDDWRNTAPAGSFAPNAFGLHDMAGNVSEWCEDWLDASLTRKVLRGASWWHSDKHSLLASTRQSDTPNPRSDRYGFRIVLEVTQPEPEQGKERKPGNE